MSVAVANRSTIVAEITDNDIYGLTLQKIVTGPSVLLGNDILGTLPAIGTSHPWAPSRWDDLISGRVGNDVLTGTTAGEVIVGASGSDTLTGGGGNDRLIGGFGSDVLKGGLGADGLVGGPGQDHLTGGAGADVFVFGADAVAPGQPTDTIADFRAAEGDKIRLVGIDAVSGGRDDAFTFIGSAGFSGVAGQLHYRSAANGVTIEGDTNGDGVADFSVSILGVSWLAASNFGL